MKLFQYWNSAYPPDDVAGWIAGFKSNNPEFDHRLFDEQSALDFIDCHHGARVAKAFASLAIPAFQADLFRLCALLPEGGLYVDADNESLAPLEDLVGPVPHSFVFTFGGQINNGFLMFRNPEDAYLRACLTISLDNIENRRFGGCFLDAGPSVFNALRTVAEPGCRPELEAVFAGVWMDRGFGELLDVVERLVRPSPELTTAYRRMDQRNALAMLRWIGAPQPKYKQSDQHWANWRGSAYR